MHNWGDKTFDWHGLDEAIDIIVKYCNRYGRLSAHGKEKYGTARIYVSFWDGTIHGLLYPSYWYNQYPKNKLGNALWWLEIYIWPAVFQRTGIAWLFRKYQAKIYAHAYQKAIAAYPKLREEITCCADYPELIK